MVVEVLVRVLSPLQTLAALYELSKGCVKRRLTGIDLKSFCLCTEVDLRKVHPESVLSSVPQHRPRSSAVYHATS